MNDLHPGDMVLNAVLRLIKRLYLVPKARTEQRLETFLKPKYKALERRKDESARHYLMRLQTAFSGPAWYLLKRRIATDYADANDKATEVINTSLTEAFAAGLNESAYALSLTGVESWPITVPIVASLVTGGVLALNVRKLKRGKDIKYNEERLQTAVSSALVQGIDVKDLPRRISEHMSHARETEMSNYARVSVYSASDEGAYYAGLEAEKAGLEIEKTWLAIMDMRVRPSHKHLHGTTIPLHEKFHGYYGVLRFPHDSEAPPPETYNCRCRMAVHLAGKSPGEYSRKILPTQTTAYMKWRDRQIRKAGGETELAKLHKHRIKG